MGKNSFYIRKTIALIVGILIVLGMAYAYKLYRDRRNTIYEKTYHSATMVAHASGRLITGECQEALVTFKLTTKSAILSVNGDKLSGVPVKLAADGGLHVQFKEDLTVIFYKADPDGDGNELLIVMGRGETLILSQNYACEDIAAFVDQIPR